MSNINSNDYYQILGISKNANDDEIRKAYKREALKYHPDKNINNKEEAEKNFKKVNDAYSILSDKKKRQQYDTFGKDGMENGFGFGDGMEHGFTFTNNLHRDIFKSFFDSKENFMFNENIFNNDSGFKTFKSQNFFTNNTKPEFIHISIGRNIIIKNLNQTEKNGKIGKIENFNPNNKRYIVKLESGLRISLKFENIHQICRAKIKKNGSINDGKIIGYNSKNDKLKIIVNGSIQDINKTDVIIENNTCIKIINIQSNVNYNGIIGKIKEYNNSNERYLVKIPGNKLLYLKTENISL